MAERIVRTIPASINRFTSSPITEKAKRKVAGYARVSTDMEEQLTSYDAQVRYYTDYIKNHNDWEFVGMYADEGITGTSIKHREGFKRMVDDALAGKIDLIVTKSVSRFARNTVDSLITVRQLKEKGVEIYFEKENIWTLDSKGELLITIMSSLAQEEARSISENCTWGQRKRFADGKVSVPYGMFLGYDKGENGTLVVNEKQAATVKKIYGLFLQGMTPHSIATILTKEGIPTPAGKQKWSQSTVRSILKNEKYKGDALLQKNYTADFLTKKQKKNNGEIPQYYVEGNHEAIISPEVFELVQQEFNRRSNGRHSGIYLFSSKIKCGCCGVWYGSKVWHSNSKYRKMVWQCNEKFSGDKKCNTPHITDAEIKEYFIKVVNQLIINKAVIIKTVKNTIMPLLDTNELETDAAKLQNELIVVSELMENMIYQNSHTALNQEEYKIQYNELTERFDSLKEKHNNIMQVIKDKQSRKANIESYLTTLQKQENCIDTFEISLWSGLVDYVTIYSKDDIQFTLRDGSEIKV